MLNLRDEGNSMRLPLTIRWTADVEREQAEKERQDQVKRKRLILLTARLIRATVHGRKASQESKTPREAGVNL